MAIRSIYPLLNRRNTLAFVFALYLLAVVFSVYCLTLKRDGLQFQTRDYSYFIEQAARLADPLLSNRFTLNIDGYNFLGLQGTQNAYSIFQAVHIEIFRYTYTVIYWLFHSSLALYIYYCLLFFLPILYFALLPRPNTRAAWLQVILFALLYLLLPSMLNSVTYDLRPRILFLSAWCLAVLAVYYRRPFLEKLFFFLFILCLREEGILLGGIVLVLNFIRTPASSSRWKQTILFFFLTLADAAAFLWFMDWGGYYNIEPAYNPLRIFQTFSAASWAFLLVSGILLVLLVVFFARRRQAHLSSLLFLLAYSAAILLTGLSAYRDITAWYRAQTAITPISSWDTFVSIISGAQNSLTFYILILLFVLLLDFISGRGRAFLAGSLGALCIFFGALSVYNITPQISTWNQALTPARLVWDFKASMDPYQANLLLDYDTYQAFYDFENIVVYNRLPLWMVKPENRFYPDNKDILARLIRDRMQYAVISQESLDNVRELAAMAGLPAEVVVSNQRYVVLQFR